MRGRTGPVMPSNLRSKAIVLLCSSFESLSYDEVAKCYDAHEGNLNEVCAALATLEAESEQRSRRSVFGTSSSKHAEDEDVPLAAAGSTTDLGWISHPEVEEEEEEKKKEEDAARERKKALLQKDKRHLLVRSSQTKISSNIEEEEDEATARKKALLQANKQTALMRVRTTVSRVSDEEASQLIVDGIPLDKIEFDYADEEPKLTDAQVTLDGKLSTNKKKRLVVKLRTSVTEPLTNCKVPADKESTTELIASLKDRFEHTGFELGRIEITVERTPRDYVVLRANLLSTLTKNNEIKKDDDNSQLILPPLPTWVALALRNNNSSTKTGAGAGATAAALAAGITVATGGAAVPIVAPIAAAVVGGTAAVAAVTSSKRSLRQHIEDDLAKCTFIKDVQVALLTSTAPTALKDHAIRTLKRFMTHGGHSASFNQTASRRPSIVPPTEETTPADDIEEDTVTLDDHRNADNKLKKKKKLKKKTHGADFNAAWKDSTTESLQRPSRPAPPPPPQHAPPPPPVFQV